MLNRRIVAVCLDQAAQSRTQESISRRAQKTELLNIARMWLAKARAYRHDSATTRKGEAAEMSNHPFVDACRTELQAMNYERMNDDELAAARQRHAVAHHSSAIEGIHPGDEQAAFWDMLLEERVPNDVLETMTNRFLQDRIVGPARTRQPTAQAEAPEERI